MICSKQALAALCLSIRFSSLANIYNKTFAKRASGDSVDGYLAIDAAFHLKPHSFCAGVDFRF